MAQPGTITGSIGVIMGKLVNSELLRKLRFNAVSYLRGDNANLVAGESPFSDAQREMIRDSVEHIYEQFLERVADSREMAAAEIDGLVAAASGPDSRRWPMAWLTNWATFILPSTKRAS